MTLRDAAVGVVVLLLAILLLSIGVGFWAADRHPTTAYVETEDGATVTLEQPSGHETFDTEVAAIFGTAVGTTLLALVTGLLAIGTWKDVRASQAMVKLDPRRARRTHTPRRDRRRRESDVHRAARRPAVQRVGEGGALERRRRPRRRTRGRRLLEGEGVRRHSDAEAGAPSGATGAAEDMFVDVVMKGDMLMSDFDEKLLEVTGTYRDWLNKPAGPIIDWTKSPTIRPPAAGAVAGLDRTSRSTTEASRSSSRSRGRPPRPACP